MEAGALLAWLSTVLALSALALPVAAVFGPNLPHRGAAFAPAVALGTLTLGTYWIGHLQYGTGLALAGGVGALAGVSALARVRGVRIDYRDVLVPLAVFLAAFALMVWIRAADPAAYPQAGERFLDYGLVASLLRTDALPPEDIWFAGEPLRYYYGGQLGAATLTRLSNVPVRYAYNLAIPTVYATLATTAYGLGAAIAADRTLPSRRAGLAAAVVVALAGTLATPIRFLLAALPTDLAVEYGSFAFAGIRKTTPDALALFQDAADWSYWVGRYVVPDTLTVFPFWTALNGALHAHLIATPFLLLAAAVCLQCWRAERRRRRLALFLGVLPAVGGLLGLISTWSLPTTAGLAFLTLALADAHPLASLLDRTPPTVTWRRLASRIGVAATGALAVGLLAVAWAAPFLLLHRPESRGIGLFPPGSPVLPYLLYVGLPLGVLALFLAREWPGWTRGRAGGAGLLAAVALGVAALEGSPLGLLAAVIATGWWLRWREAVGFEGLLLVAGAGLLLVVELAYARVWPFDPLAPRWNTVYKVSMQVWVLWGVAAGVALAGLSQRLTESISAAGTPDRQDVATALLALALVCGGLTFPALALSEHASGPANNGDLSLDATRYVETYHPHTAEAIDWLRTTVDGQPTMLTAPGTPMYTWVSAPPSHTGIPTVLGWKHEQGYRGPAAWNRSHRHVESMYTADWSTRAWLLDAYDVRYVYVGEAERDRYSNASLAVFENRTGVEPAYVGDRGVVRIYRIDADRACRALREDCPTD